MIDYIVTLQCEQVRKAWPMRVRKRVEKCEVKMKGREKRGEESRGGHNSGSACGITDAFVEERMR